MKKSLTIFITAGLMYSGLAHAGAESRIITMDEFIRTAVEKDTRFEEILIEEMSLQYKKDIGLPAGDIVLSVRSQYEFFLDHDESGHGTTIGLSKLFPFSGTNIAAQYKTIPSATPGSDSSAFTLQISQPVARNAFGKSVRLQDKIIGTEIELIKYQVAEAYEDYLAKIITAYYNWYLAYENLKIAETSYNQNLELLDNIKKRRQSNIALPIDVNKINIQVLVKKENLLRLEEQYEAILNFIKQAMYHYGSDPIIPTDPLSYKDREISFKKDYERFTRESRTYGILKLLEDKSSLQVAKDADAILPSASLLFGYETAGGGTGLKNAEDEAYAGISLTWPFPDRTKRAALEISKINEDKAKLASANKYTQLHTELKTLFLQIETQRKLLEIADEKIKLAESILRDETENYSFGKVSLNDFIAASNRLDENRFSKILASVRLKTLMTEWFRLTDSLIDKIQ